jgi:hypothetical protein
LTDLAASAASAADLTMRVLATPATVRAHVAAELVFHLVMGFLE